MKVSVYPLLHCPFCGGRPITNTVGVDHFVHCTKCKSSSPLEKSEDEARIAWNRRVNPDRNES